MLLLYRVKLKAGQLGQSSRTSMMQQLIYNQESHSDEVLVKASFLAQLQRRVLKAEAALREKEEENDILHQRLQQYERRWSEYELKMKSMEEVWQKQMRSLQSSLSIAKKSLAIDDSERILMHWSMQMMKELIIAGIQEVFLRVKRPME
ncbi:hypothetical protein CFOL_v3_15231 [Cephalotus follicularis]|uniref:Uncharacterized protein n=1 Tax=Cephalotus follicularis TaxID=3775 RepID=A0A1Q3BUV8_CEPFO|nr:hypothetical protein CFOL_v3_15231 [Cephalotus follicularis]